jgi:hypothetical protein
MTLDDMYQIATDTQRDAVLKNKQAVTAVHPENKDEDEVTAFQRRKGNKNIERKKISNPKIKSVSKGYSNNFRSSTGQETMPTETANTVSIASYKITPKRSVSNESVIRNHVKIDKAVLIDPECI